MSVFFISMWVAATQ